MTDLGFQGRARECAQLASELAAAASGRLGIVFVEGEAGIGKTRLAAEAAVLGQDEGFAAAIGGGSELGGRPFGPLIEALLPLGTADEGAHAQVRRLLAESSVDQDPGRRYRIMDGLLHVIEKRSLEEPLLLVLDDLQWSDSSTILTVQTLARRLPFAAVCLMGLYRSGHSNVALERVVDTLTREGAQRIALGPLASDDVAALARDVLGADPGPRLSELLAGTGGNPLFLTETLGILRAERGVDLATGRAEIASLSLPPSLRETLLRRISFLSEPTRELLRVASLLGVSFAPGDLASVVGQPVLDLTGLIEEARRAGLLVGDGQQLRFRHDVIRDAVYEDMPPGLRAALHTDVARKLALAGASSLRVGEQYVLGSSFGDLDAVEWLARAAAETASTDPSTAVELLGCAIDIAPPGEVRNDVLAQLATVHAYGGSPAEAERIGREVLSARPSPALASRVQPALVHALFTQGRWTDVIAQVEAACAGAALDDPTKGRLVAESALARIWTGDLAGASRDAEEAIRLGEGAGDDVAVCFGLGHLSVIADERGEFHKGVELAQRAMDVAERGNMEAERRHPHIALGMALFAADRLGDATSALAEGRRLGESCGTVWDLPLYHAMTALPLYYLGEWDESVVAAEASLSLAEETGVGVGSVTALALLADIAVHRGDVTTAGRLIADADAAIDASGPQWGMFWLTVARAGLLEAAGDRPGAVRCLEGEWRESRERGYVENVLRIGPLLVRFANDHARALRIAEIMEDAAAQPDVPYATAGALVCRGLAQGDAAALLEAVEQYRAADRAPDVAATCADAAALLARTGEIARAGALFDESLGLYEGMDASREAARVAARMREAGIRRGVRGTRARPTTGWEALTPKETEVARLAAKRLTNPEIAERLFVSRSTVKTHLTHIFAKLGISSRRALAAKVPRHR